MSDRPTILIVDDEKNTREGLSRALKSRYNVVLADQGETALQALDVYPVDIVLSDVRMPGMDGMSLLKRILVRDPQPLCILLTAYGSVETAVEAMKNGAYDFLTKPVNLDHLDLLLKRALHAREIEAENLVLHQQLDTKYGLENMIGNSAVMHEVFETIKQVAPSRATVLIQGESGTGKELVARALHRLSPRSQSPFIPVHCAALSESLLPSELFGHEKGAFTNAMEQRKGRFELADHGTLFLDEIGEVDPSTQVKILRVLEERCFERVGGSQTVEVDVRLITATNKDLRQMVEDKAFREDLYFRLNVVLVQLPPLRERIGDIPTLAHHFVSTLAAENNKALEGITAEAIEALNAYHWPGNVRELRNVIERMVVLCRGDKLTLRDVPAEMKASNGRGLVNPLTSGVSLEEAEQQMIMAALKANDNNRTRAAEQLGISRRTLHRKLNEYGLREK
ncbi:MAG: two-component system response regulator AtoC [Kiritimatiellia bacterium]|jgi:two-component system, NtrC family, response regulator AtoC